MQSFEYANPTSVQEAAALLGAQWGQADVLAGGTDLLSLMKEHLHTPKRVVNIKNIKELEGIQKTAAGLRIGALVTMDELAKNADVKSAYKSLADAAAGIPSPQIRHMGTAGGDLCQRPRCWYYRQGMGLLGMKDGKSLVQNGENQYHSIFGSGPAYFVSSSSLGPALVALGAKVKLVSAAGSREVPVASFFVVPQNESAREIALKPNELLTEIIVPAGVFPQFHLRSAPEGGAGLASGGGVGSAAHARQHRGFGQGGAGSCGTEALRGRGCRKGTGGQDHHGGDCRSRREGRGGGCSTAQPECIQSNSGTGGREAGPAGGG